MAVIITDMDMPKSCCECEMKSSCSFFGLWSVDDKRDEDCPLKSLEDMKSEILTRMWNCRGKQNTSIDKVKMEIILKEIIDKYCDGGDIK